MCRSVIVLAVIAAACGGRGGSRRADTMVEDDAVSLAAMLPARSDRCLVARPGLLSDRQRSLYLHATDAEVLAWSGAPRVAAYASARAVAADGSARITIVRLAEPLATAREALRTALPLRVRFEDEACHADECDLPIAQLLDERTIRFARGVLAPITRGSPCLDLAIAHPRAIEVSVEERHCDSVSEGACLDRRIVEAGAAGIRVRQQLRLSNEERARILAEALAEHEGALSSVQQRGATVTRIAEQSWDALQLRLEDERIDRMAIERRARARRRLPIERVDMSRPSVIRQQVRLREEALARARGAEARRSIAEDLGQLLARAIESQPDELELASQLVRLRLDELEDAEGARLVAEAALDRADDRTPWELLVREARIAVAARVPEDEVALASAAEALVAAGIVGDDAMARAAVRDLAAIRAAGIAYEVAESSWAHAREVLAAPIALSSAPRGSAISLAALPATFAWLAALEGISGPFSAFVAVRFEASDVAHAPRVDRTEEAFLLRFDGLGEQRVLAGHAASDDALLRLGTSLESALMSGEVTIDVTLNSLASSARLEARLAGALVNGRLRIDRADARTAARPWPRIDRYLAEPLHVLGARLFPPPDLVVIALEEAEAQRLVTVADGRGDARCAARGIEVRCSARSDRAPFEALRAIARTALVPATPRDR